MTDAEIETFVRSFEDLSLPRNQWTHAGHLTVALWYLSKHTRAEATGLIRDGIIGYNRHGGKLNGYHETVTLAWIEVIDRFLAERDRSRPISELVAALLEAVGGRDYLLRHYSRETLFSDLARARWVPPDRLGFGSPEA
ncbi:MAG: hypothetical protein AB7I30_06990 [Isosphaeraceae bacterium]